MPALILQISDCHLVAPDALLLGVDTDASLRAVLRHAVGQRTPDAIVATGDLAHEATADVYRRFGEHVAGVCQAPMMCLPGNHDVLAAMYAAQLPMAPLELDAWALVPLDSHEDDAPRARVEPADLAATTAAMTATDARHILLATHHPMIEINSPWLDVDRIQNGSDLIESLASHSGVATEGSRLRGVIFGHAHQPVNGMCGGVALYGAPSTCFGFVPHSETFSVDNSAPGYRWLTLYDDGRISTEVVRVESFSINPVI